MLRGQRSRLAVIKNMPEDIYVPIRDEEFFYWMNLLGPFEQRPRVAVACSGGPDSMALLVLAKAWLKHKRGSLTALIVDHGLREESRQEAKTVQNRIWNIGLRAVILSNKVARLNSKIQETAREIRYLAIRDWCEKFGCLHLLIGHHRDDQAETVYMRAEKGGGEDGLAGMAPILELGEVRLLRPLLYFPKQRLLATVEVAGVQVVDDPSNRDERFYRSRLRKTLNSAEERVTLFREAASYALLRQSNDLRTAECLMRACEIYPEGYAILDFAAAEDVSFGIKLRILSQLCTAIGGRRYPAKKNKVKRLAEWVWSTAPIGGRTLAGCRILPTFANRLMIFRETELIQGPLPINKNKIHWDGRFLITSNKEMSGLEIRKLGTEGLKLILKERPKLSISHIPRLVLSTLPAIWGLEGVYTVPHLTYSRKNCTIDGRIQFAPFRPLQATRFTL